MLRSKGDGNQSTMPIGVKQESFMVHPFLVCVMPCASHGLILMPRPFHDGNIAQWHVQAPAAQ